MAVIGQPIQKRGGQIGAHVEGSRWTTWSQSLDGFELGKWLKENKPEYLERFVLATGVIDESVEEYCEKYNCRVVYKPYSRKEIMEVISELAGKYDLGNKEV